MPQYGGGAFQRAESYYQDPTEYREMVRGAGAEKAQYLSMMDQFYAELEEEQKQFEEKMGLERERFAFEEESQEEEYQLALRGQTEAERAAKAGEAARGSEFAEQLAWQREQMKFPYQWAEEQQYAGGGGGGGAADGAGSLAEQSLYNLLRARQPGSALGSAYKAQQIWRGLGSYQPPPQRAPGTGVAWSDQSSLKQIPQRQSAGRGRY